MGTKRKRNRWERGVKEKIIRGQEGARGSNGEQKGTAIG